MTPRLKPEIPPYDARAARLLDQMMPDGTPPIRLFRTFVKNLPMTEALIGWGGYALSDQLSLSLRDREIAINRTCARCDCEYEWGIHIAFFAQRAGLDQRQIASLTHGEADDACWIDERDQVVIAAADSLHDAAGLDDALYKRLSSTFSDAELLDLMLLCGWYHAISFVANGVQLEPETGSPRFSDFLAS